MMITDLIMALFTVFGISIIVFLIFTIDKCHQSQVKLAKTREELYYCYEKLDEHKHILENLLDEDVQTLSRENYTMFICKNEKKENKYVDLNYYKLL